MVFHCKTKILAGHGVLEALKELAPRKLFLVTDPFFAENGTAQRVAAAAGAKDVEIFRDVAPDPTVSLAAAGTARLKAFGPDVVVALGGGSAMDCAKAMVYFSGLQSYFVAIPTTSGSGSEVTDFAILTHDGVKHPLVDPKLQPDLAILEGELVESLPPALIADGGFDVLAHALEAFVGVNAGAVSDALAKEAFCTVFGGLSASFAEKKELRLPIHVAATMAGIAFSQAGLGLCHGLSHVLGGRFHVPHGRLNAILLPAVIGVNAQGAGEKYAALARAAGIPGSADAMAVRNLKNALVGLRRELNLPATLAQAGVAPEKLRQAREALVAAAMADPCCATNPVKVTQERIHQVLQEVTGHV